MATQREEVVVSIGVDHSSVERGLKTVGNKIEAFSHHVTDIFTGIAATFAGAFTAEGLISGFEHLTAYVKDIKRVSEGTGLSTGLVQDLTNIAQASGVAGAAVESMLDKFAKNLKPGQDPEEALAAIADRLADMADPGEKARYAIEEFGKSGVKLIPILQQGSAGLREMASGFDRISNEQIEIIEGLDRRLERLGTKSKVTFATILEGAASLVSALKQTAKDRTPFLFNLREEAYKRGHEAVEKEKAEKEEKEKERQGVLRAEAHLADLKEAAEKQDFFAKIERDKAAEKIREEERLQKHREAALVKHLSNLRKIWFANSLTGTPDKPTQPKVINHSTELDAILREQAIADMNMRSGNPQWAAMRQRNINAAKERLTGTLSKEFAQQNAKSPRDLLIDELVKGVHATIGKSGAFMVDQIDSDQ